MCTPGVISQEEFVLGVKQFVEKAKEYGDDWMLCSVDIGAEDCVYMRKIFVQLPDKMLKTSRDKGCEETLSDFDDLLCDLSLTDDVAAASQDSGENVLKYDCHVIYSTSYQVPVLYFNVYKQTGALLTLDEIWQQVPALYQERLKHEKWTFITQQEHPLLMTPFYQLHPCHTSKLMAQVSSMSAYSASPQASDVNTAERVCKYLISWLSTVGPVVQLSMSLHWASC